MADREVRALLQLVREAENQVNTARHQGGRSQAELDLLSETYDELEKLDDLLVDIDLGQSLARLKTNASGMKSLNKKIKRKVQSLQAVSKAIDDLAKALDAVVKAFGILAGAGLL
jgi:DNA anti-recombination protein RmuC